MFSVIFFYAIVTGNGIENSNFLNFSKYQFLGRFIAAFQNNSISGIRPGIEYHPGI